LLLVVVEAVNQIARGDRQRPVDRRRIDPERSVRQTGRLGIVRNQRRTARLPDRKKVRKRLAFAVHLRPCRGRRIQPAVGAREESVEIVEAAVLGVDHDDVLDPTASVCVFFRFGLGSGAQGQRCRAQPD